MEKLRFHILHAIWCSKNKRNNDSSNKKHIEGVGQTLKSRENLESSGLAVMYVEFLKGSVRDSTEKSGLVKSQQAFKGHAIASVWKFTCPSLNI